MELTDQQINEIADELDCGMRCFYNLKTGEIKAVPNFYHWMGADEEPWEKELREIEKNRANLYEFEGLSSHDSFTIMVDFAESVDDKRLQAKLIDALNKPKPFRNFKWQIDNSDEFRYKWFDFKKRCYIDWVKSQINNYNRADRRRYE